MNVRVLVVSCVMVAGLVVPPAPRVTAQQVDAPREQDARLFYPDDPLWLDRDTRDIPPVTAFELYPDYDFVDNTFFNPGQGNGPALDINTVDQVPDSSWFTNRIGRHGMTVEEIVQGPNTVDGPVAGAWIVTGRPAGGITPKFTIRDAEGNTYLIKLDPPNHPQLASAAELISTKILHAAGYFVPENYVTEFDPSQLAIAPEATMSLEDGETVFMRREDLERWLKPQARTATGTIRALASRFIPGTPVGQFRYHGTRADDPNDVIRHEHRRSLRGLRVFAEWLHHDDTKSLNTFDTFVEEHGRRFLRHYLIDFGATLGSGSTHPKRRPDGYEYYVEGKTILKGILGLGLWTPRWAQVPYPAFPSVGRYEAEVFEPGLWRPNYPNPAFERMDAADAFWAARIVSQFTDEMVRAVVADARLTDPLAEAYLAEAMIRRREKVVGYWIGHTNPLDHFSIHQSGSAETVLTFDNAAVRVGAARAGGHYAVDWSALDNRTGAMHPAGNAIERVTSRTRVPDSAWGPPDDVGDRYALAEIATVHPDVPHWSDPVRVTLRRRSGHVSVVGVARPQQLRDRDDS